MLTVGLPYDSCFSLSFCPSLPSPSAFLKGSLVFRQPSPAVWAHPCQVWIRSAQWGTGSGLQTLAALCPCCFWLARLFTVPALLISSMLWNYTRSSSVAGAVWSLGRVGEEEGSFREKRLLQCFLTMPDLLWFLLCPFFNSWILWFYPRVLPLFGGIWDLGTFMSI